MENIRFSEPWNKGMTISVGMEKKYDFVGIYYDNVAIDMIFEMEEALITGHDFCYAISDIAGDEEVQHKIFSDDHITNITIFPYTDTYQIPKVELAETMVRDFRQFSLEWAADINYFRKKRNCSEEEYKHYMEQFRKQEEYFLGLCVHLENAIHGKTSIDREKKVIDRYQRYLCQKKEWDKEKAAEEREQKYWKRSDSLAFESAFIEALISRLKMPETRLHIEDNMMTRVTGKAFHAFSYQAQEDYLKDALYVLDTYMREHPKMQQKPAYIDIILLKNRTEVCDFYLISDLYEERISLSEELKKQEIITT